MNEYELNARVNDQYEIGILNLFIYWLYGKNERNANM